ncbi:MAG: tRNA uridine-5-carboxymethylaminomethyl(34) synthesis GTPase MnmE [Hyphomicrobiales bacterium]
MMTSDTIYAQSTGAGIAGIAVIRVSGPQAGPVLDKLAGGRPEARKASLRRIVDPASNEIIDRAVVLWMPGPNTVTGEDVAEFHVHGSQAVAAALFAAFNRIDWVRPAEAGEFTRRAFANGRMDLVEAEGLADLLRARTEMQRRQAVGHLLGEASSVYEAWRGQLIGILGHVEAALDFAEEEGVVEAAIRDVGPKTAALVASMSEALAKADRASAIRSGVKVVLAGVPNTGKSSLLNAIAARDAAIVSPRPGTTRDAIEVMIDLAGMPVILTDTAGLRALAGDEIEEIGMARTKRELDGADVVVWVSAPDIAESHPPAVGSVPMLRVHNKSDLLQHSVPNRQYPAKAHLVSSRTGAGLPEMLASLTELVKREFRHAEDSVIVRARQKQAIAESIRYLNDSLRYDGQHLELRAEDLRKAGQCLGRVTGRIDVEDLLDSIFSEFCIGK